MIEKLNNKKEIIFMYMYTLNAFIPLLSMTKEMSSPMVKYCLFNSDKRKLQICYSFFVQ